MKSLNIKYIYAQNFLCFGPEAFELNFSNYGNIVLVKGNNHDVVDSEARVSSNGVGKSSIPEIIVYTLFGKTIKHPKKVNHKDVINNQVGKGLKTEVHFGDFRVVRTRKPDSLRVWESAEGKWDDSTEISLGGQPATQKLLEEKLALNYETFVNVAVFTDNNAGSFLECDTSDKRQIVENLLSLEKYKKFADKARDLKKEKKDSFKLIEIEYENLKKQIEQETNRLKLAQEQQENWKEERKNEIINLNLKIKNLNDQLEKSSEGEEHSRYKSAQENIEKINKEIPEIEEKQTKAQNILEEAQEKLGSLKQNKNQVQIDINNFSSILKNTQSQINECNKEIERLEKNEGAKCKYCMGTVSKENYKKYTEQLVLKTKGLEQDYEETKFKTNKTKEKLDNLENSAKKVFEVITSVKDKLNNFSKSLFEKRKELSEFNKIEKPQNKNLKIQLIEQQVKNIEEQIEEKQKQLEKETPFKKIIEDLKNDISTKERDFVLKNDELVSLEKELPYYEFWSIAFGDSGIRKFIIDGIIPPLNSRIAYWLQFLIDGKIKLEFNNELEETIERSPSDGDPFVYYAMSGGERRRLNLAVSQAFSYVMMMSSGTCPSLVFLDEVTTNIDQIGVVGVYNMILELAKDRQVFITTHDQNLLDMLEGCELISLEKRKGFTRMKKLS